MRSKRYKALVTKADPEKKYPLDDAVALVAGMGTTKFDQTVDVAVRLGIDPKQSDQQVRGAVNLPHGLGKKVTVVALVQGAKEKEAKEAGADYIGGEDLIEKIAGGWMEFDRVVASPDMMPKVSKVGKVLGPRGLMPNPKTGTVTFEIKKAVAECKAGKVSFKTDKAANLHCAIGKVSFGAGKLKENFSALMDTVAKMKPPASKGDFLKSVTISPTMGPGVRVSGL